MTIAFLQFCIAVCITYYYSAIVQAITHRLFGHHNRIRAIYDTHARGHHAKYVPGRLLTDHWEDSEHHVLWYFALPFVPIAAGVAWFTPIPCFAGHVIGLVASIAWHIYLHKQYHLRGSRLAKFKWFRAKRALHFAHHKKVRRNYAIVEYWIDRVMRTYAKP